MNLFNWIIFIAFCILSLYVILYVWRPVTIRRKVGKRSNREILLIPKTGAAKNVCRKYGFVFVQKRISAKEGRKRILIQSINGQYQKWVFMNGDKHFNFKYR